MNLNAEGIPNVFRAEDKEDHHVCINAQKAIND